MSNVSKLERGRDFILFSGHRSEIRVGNTRVRYVYKTVHVAVPLIIVEYAHLVVTQPYSHRELVRDRQSFEIVQTFR